VHILICVHTLIMDITSIILEVHRTCSAVSLSPFLFVCQENASNAEIVNEIAADAGKAREEITAGCNKVAKNRVNHLRKEQISQGVLHRMLLTLGRLTFEEVQPPHFTNMFVYTHTV
jgi:hypothetical protein